jgi:hypothetical protein
VGVNKLETTDFQSSPTTCEEFFLVFHLTLPLTDKFTNGYLHAEKREHVKDMFKKIKELYKEYKPYIRVDLIMYAVLILMILIYVIVSTVF